MDPMTAASQTPWHGDDASPLTWREVTENSSVRERKFCDTLMLEHIHPIHMAIGRVHWLLGNGDGIAIVCPSVPMWIDPTMNGKSLAELSAPSQTWFLTLTTCWIAPAQRRKGYFRELLRQLRDTYGDNLAVNTHVLEAAGWLGA
jgi:hypothetical protein